MDQEKSGSPDGQCVIAHKEVAKKTLRKIFNKKTSLPFKFMRDRIRQFFFSDPNLNLGNPIFCRKQTTLESILAQSVKHYSGVTSLFRGCKKWADNLNIRSLSFFDQIDRRIVGHHLV
jgi:hypothetical protein